MKSVPTASSRPGYYGLKSYLSYIGRFKLRFGLVFCSYIIANVFLAVIPLFIGRLIGDLSIQPINHSSVWHNVIALIVASSGHDLTWRFSELLYMKLINPIGFQYETIAFSEVIRKPYPYFVDKFTGKIGAYIGTLGQELRSFMDNICYNYSSEIVRLFAISAFLIAVNWQSGCIFVGGLIAMFLVGRKTIKNSAKFEKEFSDVGSTKTGKIFDAMANFSNIISFQKQPEEIERIHDEQILTAGAGKKSFFWNLVFWGSMSVFVRHIIWPTTIILNVVLFMHGSISIAEMTTFLSAVLLFSDYVWGLIWTVSQFNLKLARIEEAHHYLFGTSNIVHEHFKAKEIPKKPPVFKHSLDIRDLSFAYPDRPDTKILSGLTLSIKHGDKIGVVGKSGSGKTTLTKLLLGYYDTMPGSLLLDSQPIETSELARLVSYVPQDTNLFHRSIADNIAYATDRKVTRNEVIAAAKRAHADEFIRQIDEGYEVLVGERGVKLSAGQRQRVAIARAFLDDKPILVLDEATSALDNESEVLVQQALEDLWQDKTVIAIAHRLSTLRHMDKIVVMDGGKISEYGSHKQLIEQGGTYAQLWSHQSGGFIEE